MYGECRLGESKKSPAIFDLSDFVPLWLKLYPRHKDPKTQNRY